MTVRKSKARSNSLQVQIVFEQIIARLRPYRQEIIGSTLLFVSVITLLSLLGLTSGTLSEWWSGLFSQLFGWGAIPATMMLGVFGGLLTFGRLRDENQPMPLDIIIGVEMLFVIGLAVIHLLIAADSDHALRLARLGAGGGFVGWGISTFLADFIGRPLTGLVLAVFGLAGLGLIFRLTVADAAGWAEQASVWAQRHRDQFQPTEAKAVKPQTVEPVSQPKPKPVVKDKVQPLPKPTMTVKEAIAAMPKTQYRLPPLDLLAVPAQDPAYNANSRYQAQIIEETLLGFGIPVEVVEINRGPAVTQFGLKLGTVERKLPDGDILQQRIRVNKVVALANDLALALSAAPIRMEAPVPGRPLVGVEVPNSEKTLVSLRAVIEDESFKKGKGALRVALGKGVAGQAVSAALANMPHLLIAGATGSGKSVCINAIISTLLMTHAPEQLRFLMVDPKMVELTGFNGIPHLIAPVVTDFEQVVGALAWVTREMERRYKLFAANGARGIAGYNYKIGARGERLPYLVVVIDELADLMMLAADEVERYICRIAQMARATGIHLVIATQRPSVDVVTGLIKANFPTRIAFAVTSQIDSRVILDTPGAERLLGRGDMLYMAPESPQLARLQGCFVSDAEIHNLVNYWKSAPPAPSLMSDEVTQLNQAQGKLPWADIMDEANKDDLLEEATKLVTESGRVSTSLLQRRLGIGYPRAARLIDQLEEEGVIGPADGSRPRDVLWRNDKDEANYAEFEKDVEGDPPDLPSAA